MNQQERNKLKISFPKEQLRDLKKLLKDKIIQIQNFSSAAKKKTPKGQEASTANSGENEAPAKITDHLIVKEAQEIISNLKETQETDPNSNEPEKIKETKEETKEVIPNDDYNEEKYDSFESEDMSDDDDETDILAMLPKEVVKRVNKLKELNAAREKIIQDYLAERVELERYYLARCKPLYDRRRSIVKGKLDDNIDSRPRGDIEESSTIKGVPQFWSQTFDQDFDNYREPAKK